MTVAEARTADIVRRRAVPQIMLQLVVAALATVALALQVEVLDTSVTAVAVLAIIAAGATLLPPIHVALRTHVYAITGGDAVLVVGLVLLGPVGFVLAVVLGELLVMLVMRQPWVKRAFNLATMAMSAALGALTYALLAAPDVIAGVALSDLEMDPRTIGAAAAALMVISVSDALATSSLLDRLEGRRPLAELSAVATPMAITLVVSLPLGVLGLVVAAQAPVLLVLLIPLAVLLYLGARAVARQRVEQDRLQRLHRATRELVELVDQPQLLRRVATAARDLLAGQVAIVWLDDEATTGTGALVDADGHRDPPPGSDTLMTALAPDRGHVTVRSLPPPLRTVVPEATTLLWSRTEISAGRHIVLAVARSQAPDEHEDTRCELLGALTTHAATVAHNVHLHEELRDAFAREQQVHSQRREFVASVSHELLTPLTGVNGAVELLSEAGDRLSRDDREALLGLALRQGARLRRLVEDLLLVSASNRDAVSITTAPVLIAEVISTVAASWRPRCPERMIVHLDDPETMVVTDGALLVRILDQLLDNAVKYAPDGPIRIDVVTDADTVVLRVEDRGPGIADEDHERIFAPFVQLDQSSTRRHGGVGIGLYLARSVVRLLGGTLRVDDDASLGTRMLLTLPRTGPDTFGLGDLADTPVSNTTRTPTRDAPPAP